MLLTIDVGNTQTVVGVYEPEGDMTVCNGGLVGPWRLSTDHDRTEDEFGVLIGGLLQSVDLRWDQLDGVAMASGVAHITTCRKHLSLWMVSGSLK